MKVDDDVHWRTTDGVSPSLVPGDDPEWEIDYPDGDIQPEIALVPMPSLLVMGELDRLGLRSIAHIEVELRKGQVSDALDSLRLALGEKSLSFRTDIRNADSQRESNRSWDKVHKFDDHARRERDVYRLARTALDNLPTDQEYLSSLREISDEDMKVSGDLTDERRFGQRSDTLPWFWGFGPEGGLGTGNERLRECAYSSLYLQFTAHDTQFIVSAGFVRKRDLLDGQRSSAWSS